MTNGEIKIVFDKANLDETLELLRLFAKERDNGAVTAKDRGLEALRLVEVAEKGLRAGELVKIKTKILTAEWTTETLVLLEPTPRLLEQCAALGVRALEG